MNNNSSSWFDPHGTGEVPPPSKSVARCYESHPPLKLGGDMVIYGGSCTRPVVKDADVYIGFDLSMASGLAYPWDGGIEVMFPITDMAAPKDPTAFRKLVEWACSQLHAGRKVHVGCIGGHGRTGTMLAALASVMLGEKDAIIYVRENYCVKAVESQAQINFLHDQFGITKVKPTKDYSVPDYGKRYEPRELPPWSSSRPANTPLVAGLKVQTFDYGTSSKSRAKGKRERIYPSAHSMKAIW